MPNASTIACPIKIKIDSASADKSAEKSAEKIEEKIVRHSLKLILKWIFVTNVTKEISFG